MRRSVIALLLASTIAVQEPQTLQAGAIVEKVEKAGAGDLSTASTRAIQEWLGKHREVADAVEDMCKPVRERADAKWADSTEGRVCSAAHTLAFFRFKPKRSDGEVFHAGDK